MNVFETIPDATFLLEMEFCDMREAKRKQRGSHSNENT
jgi:hypothetical protein